MAQIEPSIGVSARPGSQSHVHFLCQALPLDERKHTQADIITEMRRRLAPYPSYRPTHHRAQRARQRRGHRRLRHRGEHPRTGSRADRRAIRRRRSLAAQKLPSLADTKISLNVSNPEIHVAVDRKRAADLGVRMATIGNTLRLAVSGDDQISVLQGRAGAVSRSRSACSRTSGATSRRSAGSPCRRPAGRSASTTSPRIERGLGPTTLQRSNRQFTVMLIADVAPGHALDEAVNDVRRMLAGPQHAADDVVPAAGAVEDPRRDDGQPDDGDRPRDDLRLHGAGLAVRELPAARSSSCWCCRLPCRSRSSRSGSTGRTLNLWSALGMLLLLGIVKKNSILQVDYANVLRARGLPLRDAIVESCRTRLRPILMTTTAIIAGLIPTSLGIGIGGTGRAAIAVTIIGGQSLCLFLTLLLVPVAYVKFDASRRRSSAMPRGPGSTDLRDGRPAAPRTGQGMKARLSIVIAVLLVWPAAAPSRSRFALESATGLRLPSTWPSEPDVLDGKKGVRMASSPDALHRLQSMTPDEQAKMESLAIVDGLRVRERHDRRRDCRHARAGRSGGCARVRWVSRSVSSPIYGPTTLSTCGRPTAARTASRAAQSFRAYVSHPDWPWFRAA